MDELELSSVLEAAGPEVAGHQTVIVVAASGGQEVFPAFPGHQDTQGLIYVTSGGPGRGQAALLGLPHNVFTATPSGATFLPPSLDTVRGSLAREEGSLAGTEISLLLEEQRYEVEEEQEEEEEEVKAGALLVTLTLPAAALQFCPGCGASLPDLEAVKSHCPGCLDGGSLKVQPSGRAGRGGRGRRVDCSHCGKTFPNKKGLTKHRYFCDPTVLLADHALSEQQHGNADFCPDPGEGGGGREEAKKESHTCRMCNKTFSCLSYLKSHLIIHTGEKPFPCDTCGKAFNDRSALRNHIKLHTNERPFKCDVCSKEFRRSDSLKYHKASHDPNNRPFICSHCAKSFKNQKDLRSHEKTVHSLTVPHGAGELFLCSDCNAHCDSPAGLKYHRKVMHGTGRIFECEFCGKKCLASSQLEVHLRSHTGERPYKCSHCDKSFRRRNHLTVHETRHTGAGNFQCDHCSRVFPQASELKQHMKIHTGLKPYECGLCGKSFAREDYVKIHMKTHSTAASLLPSLAEQRVAQVEVKALEAGPGVTKHVYVMEPDVPGGSVHPSLLGMAHVRGDKEVGATIVIPARAADSGLLFTVPGLMEGQLAGSS